MEEARWFTVDETEAAKAMLSVFKDYKKYSTKARKSRQFIKENFSYEVMKLKLDKILEENVKIEVELKLPQIDLPKLDLPKLKKL
jgi:glycosyltransferase involved in cell wall biosynthesis